MNLSKNRGLLKKEVLNISDKYNSCSGGAKGGNTAFKRRWFVLTQYGRVLYFRSPRSFQALGQFTVVKVFMLLDCIFNEYSI